MPEDSPTAEAIRRQEQRLQRDPTTLGFAQLADLYRKAGRTREAITLCRDGLARSPHDTTARLILAKALMGEGELEAALAELTAILEVSPKDLESHRLAAEIHRRRGGIDAAVAHWEAVTRLDPGDRESRTLLGLLRADAAVPEAGHGPGRVLGDDTFVTVTFGRACLGQGLAEEAAHVFTRLLRRDPTNPEARAGLEQSLRARLRRKGLDRHAGVDG